MKLSRLNLKLIPVLFLALFSLVLSACDTDVKIENGMVPEELLSLAQTVTGEYRGQMERRPVSLTVHLEGRKVVLGASEDLLSPSCASRIGNLTQISYKEKDGHVLITAAVFDFDANLCANSVLGKHLNLRMTSGNPLAFNAEIFDHYEPRQRCEWYGGGPPGYPPTQHCWWEDVGFYNNGRFVRN